MRDAVAVILAKVELRWRLLQARHDAASRELVQLRALVKAQVRVAPILPAHSLPLNP